jgi:hypothetical protein
MEWSFFFTPQAGLIPDMKTMRRRFLLPPSISSQPRLNWIELNWIESNWIELTRSFDIPNYHIISYHIIWLSSWSFYLDAMSYISPPFCKGRWETTNNGCSFFHSTNVVVVWVGGKIGSMCKKYENAKIWNRRGLC